MTTLTKIKLTTSLFALFVLPSGYNIVTAQEFHNGLSSASSDTLADAAWSEEIYYQIEALRLQRWLRENAGDFEDMVRLKEVAELKKEAEYFAAANEFEMANIWLETIWELLEPSEFYVSPIPETDDNIFPELQKGLMRDRNKKFTWSKQLITGIDFWRQKFNFGFFSSDSTFLEGSGNPSSALRMNFEYGSSYNNSIQGYTFLKYSRDYLSGEANVRFINPLGHSSYWRVENRFEINSFYRGFNLQYFQNSSALAFKIQELQKITFDIEDRFMFRKYDGEDRTYSNYYDNNLRIRGKVAFGIGTLLGLGFQNNVRLHSNFELKDYNENRVEANWLQSFGSRFSLSLENELRHRDYTKAPIDTTFQDYWENYFYGKMRLGFANWIGLQIDGSITIRDYQLASINSLPDFRFWEINPELYFKIGNDWRITGGFYYAEETHQKLFNSFTDDQFLSTFSIPFEDFFRYGPTFSLELFQISGLIFTLQESFLMERYPNNQSRDVDGFNLFSDRNINSILLFLTWNISNRWQLNVLANMDDDRSRKHNSGDSQNTIVGIEFGYTF